MTLTDSRRLKNAASDSIKKTACNPGKLVVIHTAVILALSLAAWAVDLVLQNKIGNTGGLSGVGARSVLTTVQRVLRLAQIVALPVWKIGWIFATMKIVRGEKTGVADLAEGFRRFFLFLRLMVIKGLIGFGVILAAVYASSFIVMLTPLADLLMDFAVTDIADLAETELFAQLMQIAVPLMAITAVVAFVLYVPFFYRFRMAEYVLLDNPQIRARDALRGSRILMKGNMWKWMRLDLSFWWFWLLTILVSTLGWLDVLLPMVGIELPWTANVSYFVAYLLAAAAQLVLYYFCKPQVDVTYAHAYMALLTEEDAYESH